MKGDKVKHSYLEKTPDCKNLEAKRRQNEDILDELEDNYDSMRTTINIAKRHQINIPSEQSSPVKTARRIEKPKARMHCRNESKDVEESRESNKTPTFQGNDSQESSHTVIPNFYQASTCEREPEDLIRDALQDKYHDDSGNRFNLRL